MSLRKAVFYSVLASFLAGSTFTARAQFSPTEIMFYLENRGTDLTLVSSHRGEINGPYSNNMPENSIGAGLNAVYDGIELIEIDPFLTQDKIPYLMHDKTLKRMLNIQQPSSYNPSSTGQQAPTWAQIQGLTLCGGRGRTISNSYACTTASPAQLTPSLVSFINAIAPASAGGSSVAWGGVIQLDIRDRYTLQQSWLALLPSAYINDQVIFKFSPARLGFNSVNDLVAFLAQASYYNGNTNQVVSDMQSHMNFMAVYQTEATIAQEDETGNATWAINNWQQWASSASSFHRLLSPMVGVKGNPGKFVSTDTLYNSVANGQISGGGDLLNTVGVYSTYYECYNPDGSKNLPNQPASPYYNGFFSNGGKCATLSPSVVESSDQIDHRYDYQFISGTLNFGMIIADTAYSLINYLGSNNRRFLNNIVNSSLINNAPSGYTFCALADPSNGSCITHSGTTTIAYGYAGHFVYKSYTTGGVVVSCSLNTFGADPYPSVRKYCYLN